MVPTLHLILIWIRILYFTITIFQAMAVNLNPMYLMFPAAVATSFAFMLPVATGANAIVFSYGFVKVVDMVRLSHAHPPANISVILPYEKRPFDL